jgi:hypothetical protein
MNNLRITLFFVIAICVVSKSKAQNASDLPANSFPFNLSGQTVKTFDNRYEGVRGSYTFMSDFQPGIIELKGTLYKNVLINYDAYTDNVIAKHDKLEGAVQLRKDMISRFELNTSSDGVYAFVKRNVKGVPTFLLAIHEDSVSLYCKVSKTIKKANMGGAYNASQTNYDEFITMNTYYFQHDKGELSEIQNNKKGILKALPNHEKELTDYLKGKKLDFNDYEQMKLLSLYINEIVK